MRPAVIFSCLVWGTLVLAQDAGTAGPAAPVRIQRTLRLELVDSRPKVNRDPTTSAVENAIRDALGREAIRFAPDAKTTLRLELLQVERREGVALMICAQVRGRIVESGRDFLPSSDTVTERCLQGSPKMPSYDGANVSPNSVTEAAATLLGAFGDRPVSRAFGAALAEVIANLQRKLR